MKTEDASAQQIAIRQALSGLAEDVYHVMIEREEGLFRSAGTTDLPTEKAAADAAARELREFAEGSLQDLAEIAKKREAKA